MQWTVIAEQTFRRHWPIVRHGNLGEQIVYQVLLPGAQFLALRPPIEAVQRGRISGFVRSHGGGD
jgi:hypothetical protein